MRWPVLAVGLVALLTAGGGAGVPLLSPLGVLKRAVSAPEQVAYEGTKVVVAYRGAALESFTVLERHRRPHAYRMEYFSPRAIAGRLLVDTGSETWQFDPATGVAVRGPSLGRQDPRELDVLPEHYHLRLLGVVRVVGRPAYLLELVPKGEGVHRRFWIDQATGLILARQESDSERGVFFAATFTRIRFPHDIPEDLFRFRPPAWARVVDLRPEGVRPVRLSELAAQVRFRPIAPAELPMGFRYTGGGVARLRGLRAVVLRYTDGAATVSLFLVPRPIPLPSGGVPIRVQDVEARLYPYGHFRVLVWARGGFGFVAVGNVPASTLVGFLRGTDPEGETDRIVSLHRTTGIPADRIADLRDLGLTFGEIRRALGVGSLSASAPSFNREFVEVVEGFHDQIRVELTRR